MNDISLNFRIAVNTDKKLIIDTIKKYFGELNTISDNTKRFNINKNYVIITLNDDFNSKLALSDEDGFLYYENNIDFFPSETEVTLHEQIMLAKKILSAFRENSIKSEIISEFEHLL